MATGHTESEGSRRDLVVAQELHTLAARDPSYRALTQAWRERSRGRPEKHFDPDTAGRLDALIEGLTLHRAPAVEPHGRALTVEAIARIAEPAARIADHDGGTTEPGAGITAPAQGGRARSEGRPDDRVLP